MKYVGIEHVAAMLSAASAQPVMLIRLDMAFDQLDSKQVRDLADMRTIISDTAFASLCNDQMVFIQPENDRDRENYEWMTSVLAVIVGKCSAPVTVLNFISGNLTDIYSSINYSVPSGINVLTGARKAA